MKAALGTLALVAALVTTPAAAAESDGTPVGDVLDLSWIFDWLSPARELGGEVLPVFVSVRASDEAVTVGDVDVEPRFTIFDRDDASSDREAPPAPAPSRDAPPRESTPRVPSPDEAVVIEAVREVEGVAKHPVIHALDAVAAVARDLGERLGLIAPEPARDVETASAPVARAPPRESSGAAVGEAATLAGLAIVAVAGAAVAAKGFGAAGLRRILALFAFTRIPKEDVLGHEVREALYARIKERPGLSLNDLVKTSEVGRTAVQYHLDVLEREGLVSSRRVGRVRVYHAAGQRVDEHAAAILDHATTRNMARAVVKEPGVDQRGLATRLSISTSLAHWHLARLERANVVRKVRDGRCVRYYPGEGLANLAHLVQ